MSDPQAPRPASAPDAVSEAPGSVRTAGQLLRQARQAQGLHIAALAAAIKVTPQKLELLESERFDELPDPTFARALALAVCRYLKIDPQPVMSRLPLPREHRLEHINRGLATTFRDGSGHHDYGDGARWLRPGLIAPLLVLVAALVVYMLPDHFWKLPALTGTPTTTSSSPSADGSAALPVLPGPATAAQEHSGDSSVVIETIHSLPSTAAASSAAVAASGSAVPPLTIRASGESWVEVIDARGRTLVSRMMPAGESLALDGPAPLQLRIGNAEGTEVMFRGQAVSLAASTKDNVARLELK